MTLFYKHDTTDYRILWDKTQSGYKYHELMAVTWNNLYCKGISATCEGNYSKLYRHFLRFRSRIRFICERSAENETMQFDCLNSFCSVSVRIRCICEMALKTVHMLTVLLCRRNIPPVLIGLSITRQNVWHPSVLLEPCDMVACMS